MPTNKRLKDPKYLEWRRIVLNIYQKKCAECGSKKRLHCHHIRPWAQYPELRYDVNNGQVLCCLCHMVKHPFMKIKNKKKPKKENNQKSVKINKQRRSDLKVKERIIKKFSCAERYKKNDGQYKSLNTLPK